MSPPRKAGGSVKVRRASRRGKASDGGLAALRKRLPKTERQLREGRFTHSRIEAELANKAKFSRDLFDSVPVALAMRDGGGKYLYVNRTWVSWFGSSGERVVGTRVQDRAPPEEAARVLALDRAALERGPGALVEANDFELRGRRYSQTRTVMTDERGKVLGVLVASMDATERYAQEQQLRDQMVLTSALIDENPSAMYLKDKQGCYITVNDAWLKMVGVTRERAIGRNVLELFPEKESERYHAEDMRLLAQGEGSSEVESLRTGPDGRPQWVIIRKAVLRRADGQVIGLIGANTDITKLKQYEAQLADRAKFISELVDALPISIALRDTEGRFLQVNRAWESYFNVRREHVLGKRFDELPGWRENPELAKVTKGATALDRETLALGPDHHAPPLEQQGFGRSYLITRRAFADISGRLIGVLATGLDITEQRAAEQALKRAEHEAADRAKFIAELVDALPVSIALRDTEGRFLRVNRTWERYFQLRRDDVLGKRVGELPGWDTPELAEVARVSEQLDREAAARGSGALTAPHERTRHGRTYLVTRQAFVDTSGRTIGVLATGIDTTESKVMEEALKRAEREAADRARFVGELVDALPISVAMRDVEGRYMLVNRAWESYFGVRREDALGRRRRELPGWKSDPVLMRDAGEIERLDREFLARGPDYLAPSEEVHRLGRYYLMTRRVLADSGGSAIGVLSAGLDMTERRTMEQVLALERERLALLVRSTKAGFSDWDAVNDIVTYSDRYKELLGYPSDADTSKWPSIFEWMHPEDREPAHRQFRNMIRTKSNPGVQTPGEAMEYRLRRADGRYVWVHAEGIALVDEAGRTRRFITSVIDITRYREQEEALRESVRLREEVERMSRHDLKTPLNSMIALSRLLRDGGRVAPEDKELLGTIERAGYRILNMVNLSLDLFRMETGTYQFHPQAVDIAGVACRVAADLEGQAASKSLDVRVRANGVSAATQEVLARGDELLCYSMFANLVKNAIEASPPGGTVSISLKRENESVVAEVHNAGAVPEGMRGRFFRKYATTGKSAGLGLGTYSAQLMARVQEGELSLETSEERGTTLIARLKPAEADLPRAVESRAAASASAAAGEALPPRKVLVVDDDEFNRLVLRRYLPVPPLSVAFAVNGLAALEAASREWPDVVLLDLEMPVMDGYEAARRLREMERAQGLTRCLIVAISSNDEEPVVKRALAAGCDQYVVKPAPRQVLWRILGGALSDAATEEAPAVANASDAVIVDEDLRTKLPEFLRSRRELLDQMPQALATDDRPLFKRSAHRLAGSFALFGFAWAAAQCRAIEGDALAGYPHDLELRVAAVRAHLDSVAIVYAPAKGAVSAE